MIKRFCDECGVELTDQNRHAPIYLWFKNATFRLGTIPDGETHVLRVADRNEWGGGVPVIERGPGAGDSVLAVFGVSVPEVCFTCYEAAVARGRAWPAEAWRRGALTGDRGA